jgi:predicted transcriptional regulator
MDFDLLGDPIPPGFGRRGRPQHLPTDEKRRIVVVLMAFGRKDEEIAASLGITPPTLRKHYFRELRGRADARARLDAKLFGALLAEVEKGNVTAIDKMFKRLDRHDLAVLSRQVADRGHGDNGQAKGKKEQQREAAGKVTGRLAPPAPPRMIN